MIGLCNQWVWVRCYAGVGPDMLGKTCFEMAEDGAASRAYVQPIMVYPSVSIYTDTESFVLFQCLYLNLIDVWARDKV